MVGTPIRRVDHSVGCARKLVVEPAHNQPADDRLPGTLLVRHKVAGAALDAVPGQSPVDALDDVGAFAQRPQGGLGVLRQMPSSWTDRLGKPKALELPHARDHRRPYMTLGYAITSWPKVNDPIMPRRLTGECSVELGPAIRIDLGFEITTDFEIGSRPELERGKMRRTGAHAVADVVAGEHQVGAVVGLAAHQDMGVGIVGVPVVDPDPIEPRTEIALGLRDQVSGESLEIGELLGVLRRDDEAEVVAIAFAALGEGAVVGIVALGIEHPSGGTLLRYAFPA
jgi:hypothetical protein